VALGPSLADHYLVAFPHSVVLLAVSPRMSGFVFKAEYPRSDISCTALEDGEQCKNALRVTGPKMEPLVAVFQSKSDQLRWLEILNNPRPSLPSKPPMPASVSSPKMFPQHHKTSPVSGGVSASTSSPMLHQRTSLGSNHPQSSTSSMVAPRKQPNSASLTNSLALTQQRASQHQSVASSLPPCASESPLYPLRPAPPVRPKDLRNAWNMNKDERAHDIDAIILRIVEGYCSSAAGGRQHAPSPLPPAAPPATGSAKLSAQDSCLATAVQQLRDQVAALAGEQLQLRKQVEQERAANGSLRAVLGQLLPPGAR